MRGGALTLLISALAVKGCFVEFDFHTTSGATVTVNNFGGRQSTYHAWKLESRTSAMLAVGRLTWCSGRPRAETAAAAGRDARSA